MTGVLAFSAFLTILLILSPAWSAKIEKAVSILESETFSGILGSFQSPGAKRLHITFDAYAIRLFLAEGTLGE